MERSESSGKSTLEKFGRWKLDYVRAVNFGWVIVIVILVLIFARNASIQNYVYLGIVVVVALFTVGDKFGNQRDISVSWILLGIELISVWISYGKYLNIETVTGWSAFLIAGYEFSRFGLELRTTRCDSDSWDQPSIGKYHAVLKTHWFETFAIVLASSIFSIIIVELSGIFLFVNSDPILSVTILAFSSVFLIFLISLIGRQSEGTSNNK